MLFYQVTPIRLSVCTLFLGFGLCEGALAGSVRASDELVDADGRIHRVSEAFDGRLSTGWAVDGGRGSWIELGLDRRADIVSVSIWPGDLSEGTRSAREHGRPRTVTVVLSGGAEDVREQVRLPDPLEVGATRVDIPIRGEARVIRVEIDDIYEGLVFSDTVVAELGLNFAEGVPHPWVEKIDSWTRGTEGEGPKAKDKEQVLALYERVRTTATEGEGGDPEALEELMDRAADGSEFVRKWVDRYVPFGYRVHAIPPNEYALDALIRLQDPNAISALEKAAVRVKGHAERNLHDQVERLYAYQTLIGGADLDVPNWGREGWAFGELRGFGEPLQVQVDDRGRLFVADTGNHRVMRFTSDGVADWSWPEQEPALSNVWFSDGRPWYVAAAAAGEGAGRLSNPIDLALVPSKEGDGIAVLDARGWVRVFDAEGHPTTSFQVPVHNLPLLPGVGGQGYLVVSRGRFVVLWADTAWVYDMEGHEVKRWEITDGIPSGVTILPNGKLLLVFQQRAVQYDADGFRHGTLLGEELGVGFENWDITVDEEGALWALTDRGRVLRYKKPGKKIALDLQLTREFLEVPRIAVRQGVLYVTQGDRVEVFDVGALSAEASASE